MCAGNDTSEQFVSEPLTPVQGCFEPGSMTRGEPGLPLRFIWRVEEYEVAEVLEAWKETGPCKTHGSEQYLRKHWWRIRTTCGLEMTIYFERQPRSKRQRKARWWLYTVAGT